MSSENDIDPPNQTTFNGSAVKGNVAGAKVDVYAYSSTGTRGELLYSTITDAKDSFDASMNYRGTIEIIVSEGKYFDEATGVLVPLGDSKLRLVTKADENTQMAGVIALTTVTAAYVDAHASSGLEIAIKATNERVADASGLKGIDNSKEIPADLSVESEAITKAQAKYGAVQAGLSQIVKDSDLSPDQLLILVQKIAEDFSDGKTATGILEIKLNLAPVQAMIGLNAGISNFLSSPENVSSHSSMSIGINVPNAASQGG
ncbi:hypothetical protein [Cyclobacterium sp.]|uniref:hypothetical protein n=1 Tax=Cyclobacterium sp. TaxID=1966343 RepID=UPI0019867486|nr:hypothetical protein [Cyclobacterium sp.]MBD3630661.1 hypothetical protein [Cyclobacterium sp.]